MKALVLMSAASLLALGGCANFYPPSRVAALKPNTHYWASYDASRRGATFVTDASGQVVRGCSEPAPDVALSLSTILKAKAETQGVKAEGELSASATALALAGRDNVVLLAREALFRICEQAASRQMTNAEVVDLIKQVFQSSERIAVQQAATAKEATKQSLADAVRKTADPAAKQKLVDTLNAQ